MRYPDDMYNKLFTKILDSSIWLEGHETRLVWLTLLAVMDQDGFAQFASVANLSHRARVSLPTATKAVELLSSPDENSSDPEYGGRRIERVPGGWIVLNAPKYREIVTREIARERTRERVAKHRKAKQEVTDSNTPVTVANESVTPSEAVAETSTEPKSETTTTKSASSSSPVPLILSQKRLEKLKETHAYVGSRLRIPHVLHDELRTKLGGDMADLKLMEWYQLVNDELDASQTAIPDVFKVVRPRFEAWVGVAAQVRDPQQTREQEQLRKTQEVARLVDQGVPRWEAMRRAGYQ